MNVKMVITMPLAIILFVSGVYCPSTSENETPSRYPLQSCRSHNAALQLDSSRFSYEIDCSENDPTNCRLIEQSPDGEIVHTFRRSEVEFISMKDAELTLIVYPVNDETDTRMITCNLSSLALARKFYKAMARGRQSELVSLMRGDYLKKSDGTVLVDQPNSFLDKFANYATIVIKNDDGDPVLIFPTKAISQIAQSEATEINVSIRFDTDEPIFIYKFGFTSDWQTSAWSELLHRLILPPGTFGQRNRRPYRDSNVEAFFNVTEPEIQRKFGSDDSIE